MNEDQELVDINLYNLLQTTNIQIDYQVFW